jgi:hypothetical protein
MVPAVPYENPMNYNHQAKRFAEGVLLLWLLLWWCVHATDMMVHLVLRRAEELCVDESV